MTRRFIRRQHGGTHDPAREFALLRDATGAETGDPLNALNEAVQTAREVREVSKAHQRFSGAEVDLAVARELRAISESAYRAADNLRRMREFLEGNE